MKKLFSLVLVLFLISVTTSKAQSPEVRFKFTPAQLTGHEYAPNHVFAVWVKTSNNEYVKSLMIYADKRIGYLEKWSANKIGSYSDAVSGATQRNLKEYTATWDMKTFLGTDAPAGDYKICFEMSSGEHGDSNPFYEFPITISTNGFSNAQADKTYLKNIQLTYFNGVNTSTENVLEHKGAISLSPNPANVNSQLTISDFASGYYNLSVYSLAGKKQVSKIISIDNAQVQMPLADLISDAPNGQYIIQLQRGETMFSKSFILRR